MGTGSVFLGLLVRWERLIAFTVPTVCKVIL